MRRFLVMLLIVAMGAVGCKKNQASARPDRHTPTAFQKSSRYKLAIAFNGLIGYVLDKDKNVWALLPKADKVDASQPGTLPPGIVKEALERNKPIETLLPVHLAYIRFTNAKVTGGTVQALAKDKDPTGQLIVITGRPIAGDVSFVIEGAAGPPETDLSGMSDSGKINHALQSHKSPPPPLPDVAKVAALDELDSTLAPDKPLDTSRLVARVRIDAGKLVGNLDPCGSNVKYSYTSGVETSCADDTKDGDVVQLAEGVVVTQEVPAGKSVTVKIGQDSLEVAPQNENDGLRIEVINSTATAIHTVNLCLVPEIHPVAFRWFYRLVPQPQMDTTQHYFPCRFTATQLPPICAGKFFRSIARAK